MAHELPTARIQLGPCAFVPLNLPPFALNWTLSSDGQKVTTRCLVRHKYVALEPEEWVRQHWLHYLSAELGYPLSLTAVEMPLALNGQSQFADIVCHNQSGDALLMAELKRPNVRLSKAVLDQILRYHLEVRTPLLVISNGLDHQGYRIDGTQFEALDRIPSFAEMTT
jgi:hypothetical protein